MNQSWFKNLKGRKFLEGLDGQAEDWSDYFKLRNRRGNYYISWKDDGEIRQVEGTPDFINYSEARSFLHNNWKSFLDNEFEKELLDGSTEG